MFPGRQSKRCSLSSFVLRMRRYFSFQSGTYCLWMPSGDPSASKYTDQTDQMLHADSTPKLGNSHSKSQAIPIVKVRSQTSLQIEGKYVQGFYETILIPDVVYHRLMRVRARRRGSGCANKVPQIPIKNKYVVGRRRALCSGYGRMPPLCSFLRRS